ncbi:5'-3' exonuclease, partial [Kingella kingae]|uniref:5'-3' exonuclease n=1 Tax=Kingella kingae TaxID=504 RepID=UPI002554BE85
MTQKTLLLVDGSSYLYRAFYAMTHLSAPDGTPTNAVYGVLNMLKRLRAEQPADYCAVVFDAKGKNFRHALYEDYKATRPPMPDELRPQADMLPDLVDLMGWKVLKISGVEADDVIGTLAIAAAAQDMNVIISTGDKDMAQLVSPRITLVNTMKNETLDHDGVVAKFGVKPEQIRDFLALMGDKVDNVPGVEKCGEKTAAKWLAEYGSLNEIMRRADEFKGKIGENLRAALVQLPLSYELVTIKTDVDLSTDLPRGLDDLQRQAPNWAQLAPRFRELGFKTWLKEAEAQLSTGETGDLFAQLESEPPKQPAPEITFAPKPEQLNYQSVTTAEQLADLVARLHVCMQNGSPIGLDTETTCLLYTSP